MSFFEHSGYKKLRNLLPDSKKALLLVNQFKNPKIITQKAEQ